MKGFALYFGLFAAAALLFAVFPGVDLAVSGLFYRPGGGFPFAAWPPFAFMHHEIGWIAGAIAAVIGIAALWLFLAERPLWRLDAKALVFLGAAVALGPGLFANTVLKDHWGRARPSQIVAFGGQHRFTPALEPAGECDRNCSFVSGDAALGFALVGFAFLLPPGRRRRRGVSAALAFGAAVGLVRIAQGGHFLSDVVFAGFLVYGTNAVLWWWVVERDGLAAPALRRAGAALATTVRRTPPPARWTAATAAFVILAIAAIDRPLALALHRDAAYLHDFGELVSRLGRGWGYLCAFAAAFLALHRGGALPRLAPYAARMRALAAIPAFLFAAVAASGLTTDLLKLVFGRARPKLLFADGLYGFGWFSLDPRHWSFPSGHATTIAALMAALWLLWPRHLLFYILVAAIVAGSRVVALDHYLGDVIAGAFIGIVVVRGVATQFGRWGVDLDAARQGRGGGLPPWPSLRELGARLPGRRGV